jgi:hypothetical protein
LSALSSSGTLFAILVGLFYAKNMHDVEDRKGEEEALLIPHGAGKNPLTDHLVYDQNLSDASLEGVSMREASKDY